VEIRQAEEKRVQIPAVVHELWHDGEITPVTRNKTCPADFSCIICTCLDIFFAEGFPMKVRKIVFGSTLALGLVTSGFVAGQDVNWRHHPNLAAAQHLIDQAYAKIGEAQSANEWDMDGHAAKAKEHLDQANREIKLAAMAANRH
jgi:hypothetical protein